MKCNAILSTLGLVTALTLAAAPGAQAQFTHELDDPESYTSLTGLVPHNVMQGMAEAVRSHGFEEWARTAEAAGGIALDVPAYTVFVAEDAAYQRIPAGQRQMWMSDPAGQRRALAISIVPMALTMERLRQMDAVTTVGGEVLPVRVEGSRVWVGDALVRSSVLDDGGTIIQVDRVLLPR